MTNILDRVACLLPVPHVNIVAPDAFEDLSRLDSTHGGFDEFLNIGKVESVPDNKTRSVHQHALGIKTLDVVKWRSTSPTEIPFSFAADRA